MEIETEQENAFIHMWTHHLAQNGIISHYQTYRIGKSKVIVLYNSSGVIYN